MPASTTVFHLRALLTWLLIAVGLCLLHGGLVHAQTPAPPHQTSPAPSAAVKQLLDAGLKALDQQPAQVDEAKKQFDAAMALAEQSNDAPGKIGAWRGLAKVEQQQRHFPAALEYYQKALDLCRASGDRAGEAKTLGSIGGNTYMAGDPVKAQQYWEQTVKIYEALGSQDEVAGYM